MKKIAVIGGGASGLMAAISAARNGAAVTVFEKNDRVGKKILQTGNGKCNYTNSVMNRKCFYSQTDNGVLMKVLENFNEKDVIKFFEELGIVPREKNGGIYPYPETATAVLDVLRMELERLSVEIKSSVQVKEIRKNKDKFLIDGEGYDRVIISTGGKAAPKTGSTGDGYLIAKKFNHKIMKAVPALTQIQSNENFFKGISGVRTEASLSLFVDGKFIRLSHGELQLTDYGLSGICSFELSSIVARALDCKQRCQISVNFYKDFDNNKFADFIKKRIAIHPECTAEQLFTGVFNKKLTILFLKLSLVPLSRISGKLTEREIESIAKTVTDFKVNISAVGDFNKAQVTSGGVFMSELSERLESKKQPGLFFAGEVVDVDGICGGYNLQWAWSSGYLAGKAAAVD